MTFTLLPAVDVANGRAVRLSQGEAGTAEECGLPRDLAQSLQTLGAAWIHLVDLDAAFGRGSNAELLAQIVAELDVPVQLSAGVRDDATLDRALASGSARIVVGTAALEHPEWCAKAVARHGDRIAIGLDVRVFEDQFGAVHYRLRARGGADDGGDLWDTIGWLDRAGCARYVVTDVSRDGMLRGPSVALYNAVAAITATPLIASGGISSLADLATLAALAAGGIQVEGAIVGTALSAGRFTLPAALEAVATDGC